MAKSSKASRRKPERRKHPRKNRNPAVGRRPESNSSMSTADPATEVQLSNETEDSRRRGEGLKVTGWAFEQTGKISFLFLLLCVIAQTVTIFITWPSWQVRTEIYPNLPWVEGVPQFSTGIILLVSLQLVLLSPRKIGMYLYLVLLSISIFMDQIRCQPQVLAITFMMAACVWPNVRKYCVWYLASLWFWAGLHKAVSPDWFGNVTVDLLRFTPIEPLDNYFLFALIIAVGELALGIIVWIYPRLGAIGCFMLHFGIALFMLIINWNFSVLPWNFCQGIVGAFLLLHCLQPSGKMVFPETSFQWAVVALMFIVPVGFYFGWVRHHFSHVLYSGNLPGAVTTVENVTNVEELGPVTAVRVEGWDVINFPFPRVHAAYLRQFELTGQPGQKMMIADPRSPTFTRYYKMKEDRSVQSVGYREFLGKSESELPGILLDDPRAMLELEKANVTMLRRDHLQMIYAVEFDPQRYHAKLLDELMGVPNVEQVQLRGCEVNDQVLVKLARLPRLSGVGLDDTLVTVEGLKQLREVENLNLIQFDGQIFSSLDEAIAQLAAKPSEKNAAENN